VSENDLFTFGTIWTGSLGVAAQLLAGKLPPQTCMLPGRNTAMGQSGHLLGTF